MHRKYVLRTVEGYAETKSLPLRRFLSEYFFDLKSPADDAAADLLEAVAAPNAASKRSDGFLMGRDACPGVKKHYLKW